MATIGKTKSYDLIEMSISNGIKTIDVSDIFVQCSIYEDINLPTMTGQIIITDSIGLVELFPFVGKETITIRYTTSKQDEHTEFNKTFFIHKISDVSFESNKKSGYVLHLNTIPYLLNSQISISRSYTNTAANIIKNICTNMLDIPSYELFVDPTYETRRLIFPNIKPFEAINKLANITTKPSSDDKVSDFVFFENSLGFNFKSLQTLSQVKSSQVLKVMNDNPSTMHQFNMDKVRSFQIIKLYSHLENIEKGMFSSTLNIYDSISKDYKSVSYNYTDDFYTNKQLDSTSLPIGNGMDISSDGNHSLITINQDYEYSTRERTIQARQSQLQAFSNYAILCECEGNVDQTVGKVVDFDLISMRNSNSFVLDANLSGRYLIFRKKHTLYPSECLSTVEIRKNCLKGSN